MASRWWKKGYVAKEHERFGSVYAKMNRHRRDNDKAHCYVHGLQVICRFANGVRVVTKAFNNGAKCCQELRAQACHGRFGMCPFHGRCNRFGRHHSEGANLAIP